jgi:Leucine-rich repeat (LRR) protein
MDHDMDDITLFISNATILKNMDIQPHDENKNKNILISLATIPSHYIILTFDNVDFEVFPVLPKTIRCLNFSQCRMLTDDDIELHEGIDRLRIELRSTSVMLSIKKFPSTLRHLHLRKISGTALPDLPDNLESLTLTRDHFETYPSRLPRYLTTLDLSESNWTELPNFPDGLETLKIWGMKIANMLKIPESVEECDLYTF